METMYWIDVIGNISTVISVFAVLSTLVAVICLIVVSIAINDKAEDDVKFGKKWSKRFGIAGLVFLIASVFIPSTKSMCMIYGIGGTIDYIKSNDTAKELPDKVVIALDKYIDSLNKNIEENND